MGSTSDRLSLMTRLTSRSEYSLPPTRENFSRLLAISEARNAWAMILSRVRVRGSSGSICRISIWALEVMTARGVFTSWAMPAASRPMDESFSACINWSSRFTRSVRSLKINNRPITWSSFPIKGTTERLTIRGRSSALRMRNLYRLSVWWGSETRDSSARSSGGNIASRVLPQRLRRG